jgi:hypothetical protein
MKSSSRIGYPADSFLVTGGRAQIRSFKSIILQITAQHVALLHHASWCVKHRNAAGAKIMDTAYASKSFRKVAPATL